MSPCPALHVQTGPGSPQSKFLEPLSMACERYATHSHFLRPRWLKPGPVRISGQKAGGASLLLRILELQTCFEHVVCRGNWSFIGLC
jgi:hypothetical protein